MSIRPYLRLSLFPLALACLFATSALAQSSAPAVSLSTVVDLAQRNSTAVRIAATQKTKAEGALQETTSVFIPSLNFGSGLPFVPSVGFMGGTPSIFTGTVQSLVFSMPQRQYIQAAQDGVRTANFNLKNAREQVALDASSAYIELDILSQLIAATQQQQDFAANLVRIETQRTEAGLDPLTDLLSAKLTAAELRLKHLHLDTRSATLQKQLAALTGLPASAIQPDHASIPEIPSIGADAPRGVLPGLESARFLARSKQRQAHGDELTFLMPQITMNLQYARNTTLLNNANYYYARELKGDNLSSGFQIEIPLFDLSHRAKVKQSAAEALRANVEAEQARQQNDLQIAMLSHSLRELDAQAEVAGLKQQIAQEQLKTIQTQLELGSPDGKQISPKLGEQAHIDERQKFEDSLDASLTLAQTRLNLLHALGHIEDWLNLLHTK